MSGSLCVLSVVSDVSVSTEIDSDSVAAPPAKPIEPLKVQKEKWLAWEHRRNDDNNDFRRRDQLRLKRLRGEEEAWGSEVVRKNNDSLAANNRWLAIHDKKPSKVMKLDDAKTHVGKPTIYNLKEHDAQTAVGSCWAWWKDRINEASWALNQRSNKFITMYEIVILNIKTARTVKPASEPPEL